MSRNLNRRRFLTIAAAASALPADASTDALLSHWRGIALGARASMQLSGVSQTQARPVFDAVQAELARLEQIFSLYQPNSEITRLNRDGHLRYPSPELLNVLSLSTSLNRATGGAFDPSVQPVWLALARGDGPAAVAQAQAKISWQNVHFDEKIVHFGRPGMAITLNGIAQGAITDQIADLLRAHGLRHVLIDMGEIAAIGNRPGGSNWQVGIAGPSGNVVHRVTLRDRAISTSARLGMILNTGTHKSHILDPLGKQHQPFHSLVSISAAKASVADGLSTALCLLETTQVERALAHFPLAKIEVMI